jgi:hypothetical protein
MEPVTIDGGNQDWESKLEEVLILDQGEADLTSFQPHHKKVCIRLAGFMRLQLELDEATPTARFRRSKTTL